MAVSRKPAEPAWQQACDPQLLQALQAALRPLPADAPLGIALSAGPDSAMLAVHAAAIAGRTRALHCLHIHHGLQEPADAWQLAAHRLAALLGVHCHSRRVQVQVDGRGIEAAARHARYQGLARLAAHAGIRHVLLGHHLDDQVETVVLRLLRGAGPLGLAAMQPYSTRDGLQYLRPWLDQPRERILACAKRFAAVSSWQAVADPSNVDLRYARGIVRRQLAPVLDAHWPAWKTTLSRHARQAAELAAWSNDQLARQWQTLDPDPNGRGFSLQRWRACPANAQALLLRHWLARLQLRMPSEARLNDWLRQLREVHALGHDRQVLLRHEGGAIVVRRGRVQFIAHGEPRQSG